MNSQQFKYQTYVGLFLNEDSIASNEFTLRRELPKKDSCHLGHDHLRTTGRLVKG